jgi:hypothetical protein
MESKSEGNLGAQFPDDVTNSEDVGLWADRLGVFVTMQKGSLH